MCVHAIYVIVVIFPGYNTLTLLMSLQTMFDVSKSLTGNNLQSPADGQKVSTHSS